MSSDEDYMSDAFLASTKDVRPSLIQNASVKRKIQLEAKKLEVTKSQKKLRPEDRLQEGLQCPIGEQNKGFKLLSKMGYKQGDSLGKSTSGITEPIGLNIKTDRAGLGRETALKDLEIKKTELYRKRLLENKDDHVVTPDEYRQRMQEKSLGRFMETHLKKCQKTCQNLDLSADIKQPHMEWLWPEVEPSINDEEVDTDDTSDHDDTIEYSTAEKVEMLVDYMRTSYNYCHWCGTHYKNSKDIEENCPGPNKDDH